MSENQVNNKFTELIETLKSFYPIDEDIITKLNDNYLELSDEDLAFLNERATELLDFHKRFSKERDQYPELSNELYRLQINAIKEFLLNKSKEFQSVGDYSKIKDVIEPINEILENIPKTEEIAPGPVASTQSNADQEKIINDLKAKIAEKEKEIVRLNLEDEKEDKEFQAKITEKDGQISERDDIIDGLNVTLDEHDKRAEAMRAALGLQPLETTSGKTGTTADTTAAPITTSEEEVKENTENVIDAAEPIDTSGVDAADTSGVDETANTTADTTAEPIDTSGVDAADTSAVATEEERQKTLSEELDDLQKNKVEIPTGVNTDDMAALISPQMRRRSRTQEGQVGGSDPYVKMELDLDNLLSDSKVFNTSLMLQVIGILSDKEIFDDFFNKIFPGSDKSNFIKLFFVKTNDYLDSKGNDFKTDKIYKYLISKVNSDTLDLFTTKLSLLIDRDTYHYKKLIGTDDGNKYIFTYTLMIILGNEDVYEIVENSKNAEGFMNLYKEVDIKLYYLVQTYKESLLSQRKNIEKFYRKLIEKKNKVFTFIKERNDDFSVGRNPRFDISRDRGDRNKLVIKYLNVDGETKGNTNEKKEQLLKRMENEGKELETYILGPFNGLFLADNPMSNREIANNIKKEIFYKLFEQDEDFCMIGYGQSGSGKTSTLIYFDKVPPEDGIVTELCNLPDFVSNVDQIEMRLTNLYLVHGSGVDNMLNFKNEYYKTNPIVLGKKKPVFNFDMVTMPDGSSKQMWYMIEDGEVQSIGKYIAKAFDKREVEPTPNNKDSSRSHVVITLFLRIAKTGKVRRLIICDLAGVENVFPCENYSEMLKFDIQYSKSGKYGKKKKPVKLDRYLCDQGEIPSLNPQETTQYNYLQPELNEIAILHSVAEKYVNTNQEMSGGDDKCDLEESKAKFITGCPVSFQFQNIHNGNPDEQKWIDFKEKMKAIFEPYILSTKLTKLAQAYKRLDKKRNKKQIASLESKYQTIYNKVKTFGYSLYPGVDSGIKTSPEIVIINKSKNLDYETLKQVVESRGFGKKFLDEEYTTWVKNKRTGKAVVSVLKQMTLPILTPDQMSLEDEEGNAIWSTDNNSSYELYKQILCEEFRLTALKYNCNLRRNEGYMINKSLLDLRTDVASIILKTLQPLPSGEDSSETFMPLFWDKLVHPYCRDLNVEDEILLKYYSQPKIEPTALSSKILKIMDSDYRSFNNLPDEDHLELETFRPMNFGVFTVINTTNNKYTNNPPIPPYINQNRLSYLTKVKLDPEELKKEILEVALNKMSTYSYYTENNKDYTEYVDKLVNQNSNLEGKSPDTIKTMGEKLIKLISTANPSTLIGSLESTILLQNLTYNELTCAISKDREDIKDKFNVIGYQSPNYSMKSFKEKYIKYKSKYEKLANKLK